MEIVDKREVSENLLPLSKLKGKVVSWGCDKYFVVDDRAKHLKRNGKHTIALLSLNTGELYVDSPESVPRTVWDVNYISIK